MAMSNLYKGKNVYISGGSSGIGSACARLFASLGANVLIFARRVENLKGVAGEMADCRISSDQRFSWLGLDVTDHAQVMAELSGAVRGFGTPHVLINSAGIAYPNYFEKIPYEMFDTTMKTNLYGTWNVLQALVPFMKETGGHIVNVSSIAGFLGVFGYTAYSASKFAVIGMSECLRSELKLYGITVSVLCPPDTDTPGLTYENLTKPSETKAISASAGLMSADEVSRAMVRGMEKKRFLIIPGLEGKLARFVKHLLPGALEAFMDFQVRSVKRRHQ